MSGLYVQEKISQPGKGTSFFCLVLFVALHSFGVVGITFGLVSLVVGSGCLGVVGDEVPSPLVAVGAPQSHPRMDGGTESKSYAGWCGTRELTTPGDPIVPLPLLPMDYYAKSAKVTWEPYWKEDARFPHHRAGWDSLKKDAAELNVSAAGHVWNSTKSKLSLAKKTGASKSRRRENRMVTQNQHGSIPSSG